MKAGGLGMGLIGSIEMDGERIALRDMGLEDV